LDFFFFFFFCSWQDSFRLTHLRSRLHRLTRRRLPAKKKKMLVTGPLVGSFAAMSLCGSQGVLTSEIKSARFPAAVSLGHVLSLLMVSLCHSRNFIPNVFGPAYAPLLVVARHWRTDAAKQRY